MARVSVGDMNRQITFQTLVKTGDGTGGYIESWVDAATIWGCIKVSNKNSDTYQQGIAFNKIGYELYVRYADVTPKINMRVKYNIEGVDHLMQVNGIREIEDTRRFWKLDLTDVNDA